MVIKGAVQFLGEIALPKDQKNLIQITKNYFYDFFISNGMARQPLTPHFPLSKVTKNQYCLLPWHSFEGREAPGSLSLGNLKPQNFNSYS